MIFCFFKRKTAYEWRISDWSSDLCSSDLGQFRAHLPQGAIAVRLEEGDDAARMRLERRQRRRDLVGIVAEVIDHRNPRRRGSDDIETAGQPRTERRRVGKE